MNTVAEIHGKSGRNGWYLQQLIKLYASFVIPDIQDKYLVIDCDTYFLKPTTFINANNKCLYNFSTFENHKPYYEHMNRLHEKITKIKTESGICHHMIYEKRFIKEIFELVENEHNKKPFYQIFLEQVDKTQILGSGASEYEIYFNYVFKFHESEVEIRKLNWNNVNNLNDISNNVKDYDYVSYHWYSRR